MQWTESKGDSGKGLSAPGEEKPVSGEVFSAESAIKRWQAVSRRVFLFGSNTLATLLVVVAGLAFSRQVLQWWGREKPSVVPQLSDGFDSLSEQGLGGTAGFPTEGESPESAAEIFFGGSPWSWIRWPVRGSAAEVGQALAELTSQKLRAILENFSREAKDFPELLDNVHFFEKSRNIWKVVSLSPEAELWLLSDPVPLSVGIIFDKPRGVGRAGSTPEGGRAVVFGMARPLEERYWQVDLFAWKLTGDRCDGSESGGIPIAEGGVDQGLALSTVPIPPGARVIFGFGSRFFGHQLAFRGSGPIDAWMAYYDRHFSPGEGESNRAWQWTGGAWRRLFFQARGKHLDRWEVVLYPDGQGGYGGMVCHWPAQQGSPAATGVRSSDGIGSTK
jgi:hypothetical protein